MPCGPGGQIRSRWSGANSINTHRVVHSQTIIRKARDGLLYRGRFAVAVVAQYDRVRGILLVCRRNVNIERAVANCPISMIGVVELPGRRRQAAARRGPGQVE